MWLNPPWAKFQKISIVADFNQKSDGNLDPDFQLSGQNKLKWYDFNQHFWNPVDWIKICS